MIAWLKAIHGLVGMLSAVAAEFPPVLVPVSFSELPSWESDDHAAALAAFQRSCREILDAGSGFTRAVRYGGSRDIWINTCRAAFTANPPRHFFEQEFKPYRIHDPERPDGLFTGYYEPEVEGSRTRHWPYQVPILRKPADLIAFSGQEQAETGLSYGKYVHGKPQPYFTRKEIEQGALEGKDLEIVWLKDWTDAFFIHVQGSGRVKLEDGTVIRLSYGAKSGLPYTGIGGLLVERGVFTREEMSMQATRAWMASHPEAARELMWENQSFIFFREAILDMPELGALGAQHVQLTPRRSLAVDRSIWMLGTPVWLETSANPGPSHASLPFHHLMIAQDTGSAIKGLARGDVFWGFGDEAGEIAGRMKSSGGMTVLLPSGVAEELGLPR